MSEEDRARSLQTYLADDVTRARLLFIMKGKMRYVQYPSSRSPDRFQSLSTLESGATLSLCARAACTISP